MAGVTLPFPPYKTPITDQNGLMSSAWQQWFQQMYVRIGSTVAVPNIPAAQTPQSLASVYLDAISSTVYTSPTGQNTIIDSFLATNTDSGAQTISVYLVPVNATPGLSNLSVSSLSIAPGATVTLTAPQGQVLGGGGYISCNSSKANAIAVRITGRKVS